MTTSRLATLCLLTLVASAGSADARYHDDEIRKMIVEDSLARYSGDCPCPYSYAWNGRQCADNSAYMKRMPGLYCYPQDVPPHEVERYRRDRGL